MDPSLLRRELHDRRAVMLFIRGLAGSAAPSSSDSASTRCCQLQSLVRVDVELAESICKCSSSGL